MIQLCAQFIEIFHKSEIIVFIHLNFLLKNGIQWDILLSANLSHQKYICTMLMKWQNFRMSVINPSHTLKIRLSLKYVKLCSFYLSWMTTIVIDRKGRSDAWIKYERKRTSCFWDMIMKTFLWSPSHISTLRIAKIQFRLAEAKNVLIYLHFPSFFRPKKFQQMVLLLDRGGV